MDATTVAVDLAKDVFEVACANRAVAKFAPCSVSSHGRRSCIPILSQRSFRYGSLVSMVTP